MCLSWALVAPLVGKKSISMFYRAVNGFIIHPGQEYTGGFPRSLERIPLGKLATNCSSPTLPISVFLIALNKGIRLYLFFLFRISNILRRYYNDTKHIQVVFTIRTANTVPVVFTSKFYSGVILPHVKLLFLMEW